jgi:hypothetical protein
MPHILYGRIPEYHQVAVRVLTGRRQSNEVKGDEAQ